MLPAYTFPPLALDVRDLALSRGGRVIHSGLSFRCGPRTVTAVVGPNGAGKSTLLRVLADLLPPEGGSVLLEGRGDEPVTHYLGHADGLKPGLTLREMLQFWGDLYGVASAPDRDANAAAREVGLAHALDLPTGTLSAGQRRRAGLARLILAPRPLWLLDEPGSALDRDGESLLGRLITDHCASGGLVVAATHTPLPVAPHATLDLSRSA